MSIIDNILTLFAPYECLGCSAEGSLLCAQCASRLAAAPERCYRCLRLSAGALTCHECARTSCVYGIRAGAAYSGAAKELVLRLKFSGAKAAARSMAARLAPQVKAAGPDTVIMPVPTAASRARGRGYDQAKLLARELSRQTRLPYLDSLARMGHARQVGKSRRQRLRQLQGAFRVRKPKSIHGRSILLVDDVMTTGATLEAAARALKAHGAGRVSAIVFAQA